MKHKAQLIDYLRRENLAKPFARLLASWCIRVFRGVSDVIIQTLRAPG